MRTKYRLKLIWLMGIIIYVFICAYGKARINDIESVSLYLCIIVLLYMLYRAWRLIEALTWSNRMLRQAHKDLSVQTAEHTEEIEKLRGKIDAIQERR